MFIFFWNLLQPVQHMFQKSCLNSYVLQHMQHRFQESSNVFKHSATCATRNLEISFELWKLLQLMTHRFQKSSSFFQIFSNLSQEFQKPSCLNWKLLQRTQHRFRKCLYFSETFCNLCNTCFRNLIVWIEISCNPRNTGVENVHNFLKPSATCATHDSEMLFEFICLATHATQVSRIFKFFSNILQPVPPGI